MKKGDIINIILAVLAIGLVFIMPINIKYKILCCMVLCGGYICFSISKLRYFANVICLVLISFLEIEICNLNLLETISIIKFLLNIVILSIIFIELNLLFKSVWKCNVLYMFIMAVIGIAAYYVYEFRKIPLSVSNIFQIKTAGLVLKQYEFKVDWRVICVIGIFVCVCLFSYLNKENLQERSKKKRLCSGVFAIIVGIIFFFTPLNNIFNINTNSWDLQEVYHSNGLVLECVQNEKKRGVEKPEGFSKKKYDALCESTYSNEVVEEGQKPNIILIVNESWFDLHQVCQYTTKEEEMPFINLLDNLIKGYVMNPNSTTGNSEYEILTSNSLYLRKNTIPFLQGNLQNENSIVKNLNQLGYTTTAIHSENGFSYNRVNVYEQLGFTNRVFLKDEISEFSESEIVRAYISDETLFKRIINQYESETTNPQFIYCLTMQNHGGYNIGGIEKVDVNEDMGEYTDQMEEYLGLLQYTDKAFESLVNYFQNINTPTIICMVGDHAPIFAAEICDETLEEGDRLVAMHSTPMVMWANYDVSDSPAIGNSSMVYLAETIFEETGLPLTSYYNYLKEMKKQIPIVGLGYYKGKDKQYYRFDDEGQYHDLMQNYLYLEYGNIKRYDTKYAIYNYE